MRTFEVVAVLQKNVKRALTQKEINWIVERAKAGVEKVLVDRVKDPLTVTAWYRLVQADIVPAVLRSVRKTIGPDPEIIHLELVREAHLADSQV